MSACPFPVLLPSSQLSIKFRKHDPAVSEFRQQVPVTLEPDSVLEKKFQEILTYELDLFVVGSVISVDVMIPEKRLVRCPGREISFGFRQKILVVLVNQITGALEDFNSCNMYSTEDQNW